MRQLGLVLVVTLLTFGIFTSQSLAQVSPWPMFQHDQLHTGRTTVAGPTQAGTPWTRDLDGNTVGVNNAPVIGNNGAVLIGTVQGGVYAYSASGTRLWKVTLPGGVTAPLAVAANGRILAPTNNDSCYVLDPANGNILQRLFLGQLNTGATMVGNDAYVSGNYNGAGFVFRIDMQALWYTGQSGHLWHIDRSIPMVTLGGQIAVGTTENLVPYNSSGHVSILDANCQELCSFNLDFFNGRGVRSTVSQTSTGRIVGGSAGDQSSYYGDGAFFNTDVTCAGCKPSAGHYFSSPALTSSNVIVIGTKYGLSLRDPAGCGQTALYSTGPILNPSPVIDGKGAIYVGDDNGKLWAWSAAGSNLWSMQLNAAATGIAIDGFGNLFIASTAGRLYRFAGSGAVAVGSTDSPTTDRLSLWPNPVKHTTSIQLVLAHNETVNCAVYDLSGRPIATIFRGPLAAGSWSWAWNGHDDRGQLLPPGIYWATAHIGSRRITRTVVLL